MQVMEVHRDEYGHWTHPEYEAFCDGRESISSDEMDKWMDEKGIEWGVEYRDENDTDPDDDGIDISSWEPSGLKGEDGLLAQSMTQKTALFASGSDTNRSLRWPFLLPVINH